jgi:hypothetical protein
MDLYISSLLLGAAGLGVMALGGLGHRGHAGSGARGHGHATGHGHGHGQANANAAGHVHGVRHPGHVHAAGHASTARDAMSSTLWTITSPRFLFSFALGFGFAGELLRPVLGGPLLVAGAVVGGVLFERILVAPLWNFAMRFASTPAVTLESAVSDEATAVTSFDANGQGIISLEVDGQVVQILATLRPDDRALGAARVRAGQRVRIDEVDAAQNRCTVSLI